MASAELLSTELLAQVSEAPAWPVKVRAMGPGATRAFAPKANATDAPGVVVTDVGTVRLVVALAPGV